MPRGLYRREGSKVWYVLLYHNGQRIRESTRTTDRKKAEAYYDELRTKLRSQDESGISWQDACVAWLGAAPRSANDRYILRALDYEDRPLREVTAESFDLAHLTPATYNRYRAIIVAICRFSGHQLKMPLKPVKSGRLRFLTAEEWAELYKELPAHLKPLSAFSIATGLRQHNVTHLRWDQIDMKRGMLWIHADEAKAGKAIGIPLSPEALAVLQGQEGLSKEWVFPYKGRGRKQGQPVVKIKTAWHAALKRAKINGFTWHGLRHTWASWHLMAGTPIETLAKLGGWEDLRMVQRYAHLATEHLAQFAGNARPWSRSAPPNQPQKQPQQDAVS